MKKLMAVLLFAGCGSSSPTNTIYAAVHFDASAPAIDGAAGADSAPTADSAPAADAFRADAATMATLTFNNFAVWCKITVNGTDVFDGSNPPAKPYPIGTVVNLAGDAKTTSPAGQFIWGYWVGVDPNATVHDTSQTATVTMDTDKTVFVCCPFSDGSGCPATP
jgi:hypothetical protein